MNDYSLSAQRLYFDDFRRMLWFSAHFLAQPWCFYSHRKFFFKKTLEFICITMRDLLMVWYATYLARHHSISYQTSYLNFTALLSFLYAISIIRYKWDSVDVKPNANGCRSGSLNVIWYLAIGLKSLDFNISLRCLYACVCKCAFKCYFNGFLK